MRDEDFDELDRATFWLKFVVAICILSVGSMAAFAVFAWWFV